MLIDARIPTIATTINSSISVKPRQQRVRMCIPSNDKGGALSDTTLDYVAESAYWTGVVAEFTVALVKAVPVLSWKIVAR